MNSKKTHKKIVIIKTFKYPRRRQDRPELQHVPHSVRAGAAIPRVPRRVQLVRSSARGARAELHPRPAHRQGLPQRAAGLRRAVQATPRTSCQDTHQGSEVGTVAYTIPT